MPKHKTAVTKAAEVNPHKVFIVGSSAYLSFSFRYITSNKNYSLAGFKNPESKGIAHSLLVRLSELSSCKMSELLSYGKVSGFETIPHNRFHCKMSINGMPIPEDIKLYVFRFNNQNSRLICYKSPDAQNLFYIMAFDFEHSIYNHG
jgi:hypothetical protein